MDELTGKQRMALRNLLGAIILADGQIRDQEIASYSEKLCELIGNQRRAQDEADWLLSRVDDIRTRMVGPATRHWLAEQVAILSIAPSKTNLLDALWTVAVSDSELHPTEANIIDYAFGCWIS